MFDQIRIKKIGQKRKILKEIHAQNLMLVGKAPIQRKIRSYFTMRWPVWLKVLIFIGVFISTDIGGSRIRQGLGMFSATPAQQTHKNFVKKPIKFETPDAEALSKSEEKAQGLENTSQIIQNLKDKSDRQEYVNLQSKTPVSIKKMFGLGIKTIIIDAGHGGEDNGATGVLDTKEKDLTLDIAQILKKRLEATGQYRVLLTRSDDEYIALKDRTVIANKSGADLFLSVHVNFLPGKSINIIETFYFGPSKNATELKLAEKENEGSGFSISNYNQLIKKSSITMKLQESRLMAQSIQQNLFQSMHTVNKEFQDFGVKRAPFVVLLGTDMPGVLVEVSCLSNHDEEQRLRDPTYRETIASYIETGVIKYLKSRSTNYDTKRADWEVQRNLIRRN
jgi:N-acetylmuramoyl-L-alanine amidase